MRKHNAIVSYREKMNQQIRWKRARFLVTREIEDHMEDLYEKFCQEGDDEELVWQKVKEEMGDAEGIGRQLNQIHRPHMEVSLILGVSLFLALNFLFGPFLLSSGSFHQEVAIVCLGITVAFLLYWLDYSLLFYQPVMFYHGIGLLTMVGIFLDIWGNAGGENSGYSDGLLLIFPLLQIAIILWLRRRTGPKKCLIFALYLVLPILAAVWIESLASFVYLMVWGISLLVFRMKGKGEMLFLRTGRISLGHIVPGLGLSICAAFLWQERIIGESLCHDFSQEILQSILRETPFWGMYAGEIDPGGFCLHYRLVAMVAVCGRVMFWIMLLFSLLFLGILGRIAARQITETCFLLTAFLMIFWGTQIGLHFLVNMGILSSSFAAVLPFSQGSFLWLIMDFTWMGILLSICRHESICVALEQRKKDIIFGE